MDDVKKQKDARSAYKTLLTALDSMEWKYERDDEKMRVDFSVRGDDLAMNFIVLIDEERQLIRLLSFQFSQGNARRRRDCHVADQLQIGGRELRLRPFGRGNVVPSDVELPRKLDFSQNAAGYGELRRLHGRRL